MNTKLIAFSFAAALAVSTAVPAFAAPGDSGEGNGGCVDNLYGNATNERPDGNGVLPSQSPGPFVNTGVNEPPRDDRTRGNSVGDWIQFARSLDLGLNGGDVIPLFCAAP